jgi:serine/threonine protein kinase
MNSEYKPAEEAPQNLHKDLQIADFILLEKLGAGGMGEVWKAKQISMKRDVALKILSPELSRNEEFVERFLNEAVMTGRLQHPNIITAYTAGNFENYYYLATLFVDGIELKDKIKIDGMLPEREALSITREMASALCYAWEQHRMLHCDIKPGNIMIDRYRIPYLMDMGISKIFSENDPSPDGTVIVGSPQYMSPEQSLGSIKLDLRTDIYSLGATLYEMVTAIQPFSDKVIEDAIFKKAEKKFTPPATRNPYLTEGCSALIYKMMSNDREDRQSDWNYVIADIDAVLAGTYSLPKKVKTRSWDSIKPKNFNINAPINLGRKNNTEDADEEEHFLQTKELEPDKVHDIIRDESKLPEPHKPPPVIFDSSKDRKSGLKLLILIIILILMVIGVIVYYFIKYHAEIKQFWQAVFDFWFKI